MIKINLRKWLSGNCEYKGCIYNDKTGICECNNCSLLSDILNLIRNDYEKYGYIKDDTQIFCNEIKIQDKHCKWCGHKLIEVYEPVPYGDSSTMKKDIYCPYCN